jgi:hypothetical protein
MSGTVSSLGFRSAAATGKANINLTFPTVAVPDMVLHPYAPSINNKHSVPVMTDDTGRILKKSRISDDEKTVIVASDTFSVTGDATVNYLTSLSGVRVGTPETGYTYPSTRGISGQALVLAADGVTEWQEIATTDVTDSIDGRVTTNKDNIIGLENRITEEEDKTVYISVDSDTTPSLTSFNSGIECVDISCDDVNFGGTLRGSDWEATPDSTIRISAPDGGIQLVGDVTTVNNIYCQQQVQSTNGLKIGTILNGYTFPSERGLTDQSLQLTPAGVLDWTTVPTTSQVSSLQDKTQNLSATPIGSTFSNALTTEGTISIKNTATDKTYSLPVVGPATSNYTLMSTSTEGVLEWTGPSHYRGTRLDGISGVNSTFTANTETSVFPFLTTSNSIGGLSGGASGVTYSGAIPRTFYATFMVTVTNENKVDIPDVTIQIKNQSSGTVFATTIFEAKENRQQMWSAMAVGTIVSGNVIAVTLKTSLTSTLRLLNPSFSIFMV